jgi:hypothetical protein
VSPGNDRPPALLRGVDRASFAVALAERLRRAGVMVGLTSVEDFVRALAASPPDSRTRLYWAARISLVRRQSDLAAFDAVFAASFVDLDRTTPAEARRRAGGSTGPDDAFAGLPDAPDGPGDGGLPWMTLPPVVGPAEDADPALAVPQRLPSSLRGLVDEPFEELDPAEVAMLGRWLRESVVSWPTRRSRRQAVDRPGRRIALRPTLLRARRTGWEAVDLIQVRPVRKPRRVVMLCDVSQSMRAQASAYLHLMRALAVVASAEVFAFATTLTRLTPVLAQRSTPAAIEEASATVADRFGGTRIAANLDALLSSHHGDAVRGAIVIIGSDGWDSDPPEHLAAAMARLRRRAYRVVWMNPRAGAPGFEVRVAAMAAALPYCDELLPADTFRSLARVVAAIAGDLSSTASRGSTAGSVRR